MLETITTKISAVDTETAVASSDPTITSRGTALAGRSSQNHLGTSKLDWKNAFGASL
jgi:hypothetical protein